jgi:hypothetical protein
MYIVQPDQDGIDIEVRKWTLPVSALVKWEDRIRDAIGRAEAHPTLRTPGDHCEANYCNARATCREYKGWLDERAFSVFSSVDAGLEPEVATEPEILARQYANVALIKAWCKAVEDAMRVALMTAPATQPGWTLQTGLGNRAWTNEKALRKLAKELKIKPDDFSPRVLISPAQFEKLLKIKQLVADISTMVERPETGAKIVKAEDKAGLAELFAEAK